MSVKNNLHIRNTTAEFLIFTRQAGEDGIEVRVEDNTVWLTQKLLAALFEVDVRTISEHLGNLFASAELISDSVIRKCRTTATDGKNYQTQFYNLDAIIAVGFRVNSTRAISSSANIYATAMDYSPDAETTQTFFATVQNKRHFAIHGYTAAESQKANKKIVTPRSANELA